MISIVACCHSVKLCALAAQVFRSQQYSVEIITKAFVWKQLSHTNTAKGELGKE